MRLALALLFAALSSLPAAAEPFETPHALLEALYSADIAEADPNAPSPYSAYFSEKLNARFQADRDKTPEGEVGAIDFDPVIAGQDGEATNVDIGQPILLDNTAELEVTFTNFEPVTLYYTLIRENGGWKVDDIAQQQGDYPWSLSGLFDGAGR